MFTPRQHPYSFLLAGAGIILIGIVLAVENRSVAPIRNAPTTYISGGNAFPYPEIFETSEQQNTQVLPPLNPAPETLARYTDIPTSKPAPQTIQTTKEKTTASILPNTAVKQTTESDMIQYVYSLLPTGIRTPTEDTPRSPDQQALFEYGNKAGLAILTFHNNHANMTDVLKDWLADKTNKSRVDGVNMLADGLTYAGTSLEGIDGVPQVAEAPHGGLATALKNAGTKLRAIAQAGNRGDAALLQALKTYNAAADSFTQEYLALSTIFSLYDVHFRASDPGSAFQFSSAGTL